MSASNPLAGDLDHIVSRTRQLWDEIRGGRVFVTGGTGFFGCWLLESFLWANDRLGLEATATVLTRNADRFAAKAPHLAGHRAVSLVEGDVRDFEFPAGRFSHIIHAAAPLSTSADAKDPLVTLEIIIGGTRRTLELAVACRAQKFLLTSSGAVYGEQPTEVTCLEETYSGAPDPTDPRSAYGEAKRVAELLCAIYHRRYGLQTMIARCFAFVGPYLPLDAGFAMGSFLRDRLSGGPVRVEGDGTAVRTYLYAADLAIWLWTILFRGKPCRPYNVGSEHAVSVGDLARRIAGLSARLGVKLRALSGHCERYAERQVSSLRSWCLQELGGFSTASWRYLCTLYGVWCREEFPHPTPEDANIGAKLIWAPDRGGEISAIRARRADLVPRAEKLARDRSSAATSVSQLACRGDVPHCV